MSMSIIADHPEFEPAFGVESGSPRLGRSALVSICVALVVCGSLLATAGDTPLPGMLLALPLIGLAVEEEVRRFRVSAHWGLSVLALHLGGWVYSASSSGIDFASGDLVLTSLGIGVASACIIPALLLLVYGGGFGRWGNLASGAALGVIWGIDALPVILLWAIAIGSPFALFRVATGANLRSLPVFPALGMAASMYQLFN